MGYNWIMNISMTFAFFCICAYLVEANGTKSDQGVHKDTNNDKSVNFTPLSVEHFTEAIALINKSKIYDKLQEVLIHYVQHFLIYGKMSMLTKSGKITVLLSPKIERNLSAMVPHVIHVERTYAAIKNKDTDFTDPVNKFRFVRNNTVVLDEIIEHLNASFRAHKEIENPEKIKFYNTLKTDPRFFKIEHLHKTMEDLIELHEAATPSLSDVVTGKLNSRLDNLNSEECLDIGKYASPKNIKWTVQFYEAAVRQLDTYSHILLNKTKIFQKVIDFYTEYGQVCENRVSKLQDELKKSLNDEDEDENEDDDDAETNKGGENANTKTHMDVNKASDTDKHEKDSEAEVLKNGTESKQEKTEDTSETLNNGETTDKNSNGQAENTKDIDKSVSETAEKEEGIEDVKPDEKDELCVKEIIERFFQQFSAKHDEL